MEASAGLTGTRRPGSVFRPTLWPSLASRGGRGGVDGVWGGAGFGALMRPTSTPSSQARWNNALSGAERLKHDVRRQLHLGHAVAVTGSQRVTFIWTEDRDHTAHPGIETPLQERRTQAIGSRLEGRYIADREKGVIDFPKRHSVACQLRGNKRVTVEVARDIERKVAGDPPPLDATALSRDPAVGEAYVSDPLVYHGGWKRPTLKAFVAADKAVAEGPGFGDLPLLYVHGALDPLVPAPWPGPSSSAWRGRTARCASWKAHATRSSTNSARRTLSIWWRALPSGPPPADRRAHRHALTVVVLQPGLRLRTRDLPGDDSVYRDFSPTEIC